MATSLYGRLNAVLADIGSVPKNGHNDYDDYSYVMAGDLVDHIRPLLAKHGLAILVEWTDFVDLEDGRVKVLGKVHVGDVDGNEKVLEIVGEAKDVSKDGRRKDKAVFKAMTGAYKRWLEKNFMVATEEDEPERPGEDERKPAPRPQAQPTPAARPSSPPQEPRPAAPLGDAPSCPQHGTMRLVPAGVSKKSGKAYGAFWACNEKTCPEKLSDSDWKKQAAPRDPAPFDVNHPAAQEASADQIRVLKRYSEDERIDDKQRAWLDAKIKTAMTRQDASSIILAIEKALPPVEVSREEIPF